MSCRLHEFFFSCRKISVRSSSTTTYEPAPGPFLWSLLPSDLPPYEESREQTDKDQGDDDVNDALPTLPKRGLLDHFFCCQFVNNGLETVNLGLVPVGAVDDNGLLPLMIDMHLADGVAAIVDGQEMALQLPEGVGLGDHAHVVHGVGSHGAQRVMHGHVLGHALRPAPHETERDEDYTPYHGEP